MLRRIPRSLDHGLAFVAAVFFSGVPGRLARGCLGTAAGCALVLLLCFSLTPIPPFLGPLHILCLTCFACTMGFALIKWSCTVIHFVCFIGCFTDRAILAERQSLEKKLLFVSGCLAFAVSCLLLVIGRCLLVVFCCCS